MPISTCISCHRSALSAATAALTLSSVLFAPPKGPSRLLAIPLTVTWPPILAMCWPTNRAFTPPALALQSAARSSMDWEVPEFR